VSSPLQVWDSVWVCHDDGDVLHVYPPDDLVQHELTFECPCGVIFTPLAGSDVLVEHFALDGRA
jgi:hypothetical protein